LRYPRVPERLMPIACLSLAALAAIAVARLTRSFPRQATLCYTIALLTLGADLRVTLYGAAAAGPGNSAYTALRSQPPGRLLEIPVLNPGVQLGSVYLYYDQRARRERPGGYSTIAPKRAAELALALEPLNCGDWRPGSTELLRRLGVRYVALHTGLYAVTGRAWFAWRALVDRGYGPLARAGAITIFAPGRPAGPAPVAEPSPRLVFCQGWLDGLPLHRHTAFWARGSRLRIVVTTRDPDRITFSVDGERARSIRLTGPSRLGVPLGGQQWHLIGVNIVRTDRGLRLPSVHGDP